MNEDWNYMLDFVDELLNHAEEHSRNDNRNGNMRNHVSERISIIHFDHALELFMKAYLMKEGYLICKIKQGKIKDGIIELGARFKSGNINHRLWYSVESSREQELCTNADPFVLGILQIAMNAGQPLHIHGQVSPSLLRNLEDFQRAWAVWIPEKYKVIEIKADKEREPELPKRTTAIMCFSGGVDSCFTAYRHARIVSTRFPQPLETAIMVHGFDIPLDQIEYYESACKKVEYQLNSLNIQLYRVSTNFKEISVFWPNAYGTGVASVLALFQKTIFKGVNCSGCSLQLLSKSGGRVKSYDRSTALQ